MGLVRLHYHLDQLVANDVFFGEVGKCDAFEVGEDLFGFFQAAFLTAGQVDLGRVAGHDGLRAKADSRQEHFHLLAGGVLRFVEDDERVGERSAAHKGKRGDLDYAFLEHFRDLFRIDQIKQRVIKRPQIRVDLLLQVAGQKAEPLAGFDRGPCQNYSADLLFIQGVDRHRHCQKALACPGYPDPKHQIVRSDRVQIFPLIRGLRGDRLLSGRIESVSLKVIPQAVRPILGYLFEGVLQLFVSKRIALGKKLAKVEQYTFDRINVGRVAVYHQLIPACTDGYIQQRLEILNVLILYTEESVEALGRKF